MNRLKDDATAIFEAGVRSVQADALLAGLDPNHLAPRPLTAYRRVHVAGMGKASLAMASVLEAKLGAMITSGFVVVPEGYSASLPGRFGVPERIDVLEAGHPVPNEGSRRAARRLLRLAEEAGEGDLVLVLISGGGSALCADFQGGITLDDARTTFELLLASGVPIHDFNVVRKHLTSVGGGRMAEAAHPADVVSLVVSDVVGDDLSVIASGPTVGDPSTFQDAERILVDAGLWEGVPTSVRAVLERGLAGAAPETPKPDSSLLTRVVNRLIGTNETALHAAAEAARSRGYWPEILNGSLIGEAREVGEQVATKARRYETDVPVCLLCGGETTVTVHGTGRGGRNQEMALAAALALSGSNREIVFLSAGTDGIDGPTDAAGAAVTPRTVSMARKRGLDAREHLENNDSYTFFSASGGLVKTGHTHTNVMDMQVILLP